MQMDNIEQREVLFNPGDHTGSEIKTKTGIPRSKSFYIERTFIKSRINLPGIPAQHCDVMILPAEVFGCLINRLGGPPHFRRKKRNDL